MRLVTILILASTLQVSARSSAQRVSLTRHNATLSEVLNDIHNQTGYLFLYDNRALEGLQGIDVKVHNASLQEALDKSIAKYSLGYLLKGNTILVFPKNATRQYLRPQREIQGIVTDDSGQPLEGVTVRIKGSNIGTITNSEGHFNIEIPDNETVLQLSFLGYQTEEITVGSRSTLNITMKPSTSSLEQLVVVGYGTQKKKDLTGAVSTISSEVLENRPVTNALDALQGTAPGLIVSRNNGQPGKAGYDINIRGFSSLNGTNSPLVIIDGVEGSLSLLNPNDIKSISVLKDAAAAAIYGAKAASGVIIVTTKEGAEGKISINYTGLYTTKHYYNIPQRLHSWQEAIMRDSADANAGNPLTYTQQQIDWMKDPNINYVNDPSNPSLNGFYYDLNQIPLLMRENSPSQNHNISFSGGNPNTQYFISLGYYQEDGVLKFGPDGTKRYNARVNLTTKFNAILSLESHISYAQQQTKNPSTYDVNGDYGLLYNIYQLRTLYPIYLEGTDKTKYANTGSGSTVYQVLKEGGYNHALQHNLDGVFTLKADNIVKGLSLRAVYSPHFEQYNVNNFKKTIPLWSYDADSVAYISRYINQPNSIQKQRLTVLSHDVQVLGDYDKTFNDVHHFHLLAGFQYKYYNYDFVNSTARKLISNDIPSLNLSSDPSGVPPSVGDNIQTHAWISYFGRLNYSYKDKYLFAATVRNDASSRLAPGHRNQTFPSLSAGWVLSQEPWFKNTLGFFSQFKLRGSWGKLGNAQLGERYENNYNYIATLQQGSPYPFNNQRNLSIYQSALPSSGLGWEIIETSDIGLDLSLFEGKLTGSFDYFIRTNDNMLIALNAPAVLGVSPSTINGASMKTKGWGATLGWKDQAGDFSYHVNFNLSDNRNEITRYLGNVVVEMGDNTAIPGYPIHSIFGYIAQGYFQSEQEVSKHAFQDNRTGPGDIVYKDVDGSEKINQGNNTIDNHGDLVYLGNTSPRYNFGLNFGMKWKGIDLSVFFQGTGKRKMMIYSYTVVPFINSWRMPWKENLDYWTPQNRDARFPRLYLGGSQNTALSTHWLQNAAYIRLKNLQVGYTIPSSITEKIKIESARIFFSGEDLWEASKMWLNYYDPENPNNSSFNYPFFRSYAVGINLTF